MTEEFETYQTLVGAPQHGAHNFETYIRHSKHEVLQTTSGRFIKYSF